MNSDPTDGVQEAILKQLEWLRQQLREIKAPPELEDAVLDAMDYITVLGRP